MRLITLCLLMTIGLGACESVELGNLFKWGKSAESAQHDDTEGSMEDLLTHSDDAGTTPSQTITKTSNATTEPSVECPEVSTVEELEVVYTFMPETSRAAEDLLATIWLGDIETECKIRDNQLVLYMDVTFDGLIGAKGREKSDQEISFSHPYFVALTSKRGTILSKEIHAVPITFRRGDKHARKVVRIKQKLPADITQDKTLNEVLIGFQLNNDQLNYNKMAMEQ